MQSPPRRTAKDLVPHMVDETIISITLCNIMLRKIDKLKAKLSLAKSKKSNKISNKSGWRLFNLL